MHRTLLAAIATTFIIGSAAPAQAQVGVNPGSPVGGPPPFVMVPQSPVLYAPSVNANVFFYDGAYYVFGQGVWYMAPEYGGPWVALAPEVVPRPLLVVPVRYYRAPPPEWQPWRVEAAPRWRLSYGRLWTERHVTPWAERRAEYREARHEDGRW